MDRKYSDGNEGKCRYCGFLSKHGTDTVNFPSPRFYEVEHSERIYGKFTRHVVSQGMVADTEPMCFMEKINLTEIDQTQGRAKLLEEINADRHCESWWPYRPGRSPNQHYEELQMQRLEQDRRAHEVKLADLALEAQRQSAAIAEKDAAVQIRNAEIAEASKQLVSELKEITQRSAESSSRSERFSKRSTWLVIILAIAQVIFAFVALYHESYTDRFLKGIFGPLGK